MASRYSRHWDWQLGHSRWLYELGQENQIAQVRSRKASNLFTCCQIKICHAGWFLSTTTRTMTTTTTTRKISSFISFSPVETYKFKYEWIIHRYNKTFANGAIYTYCKIPPTIKHRPNWTRSTWTWTSCSTWKTMTLGAVGLRWVYQWHY